VALASEPWLLSAKRTVKTRCPDKSLQQGTVRETTIKLALKEKKEEEARRDQLRQTLANKIAGLKVEKEDDRAMPREKKPRSRST